MATGYGHIAAHEALGKQTIDGPDFMRPDRFELTVRIRRPARPVPASIPERAPP
ncbi:hypothetical protein [Streptomyces sp. NPDC055506]